MTPLIKTAFSEAFDLKYPIVGAPMFLVSTEKLVSAVTNAGGMGTFPALNFRPIENYRKAIQTIRQQTSGPIGINIIVQKANKHQFEQIDIALEERVPLIITSLGNPKEVIEKAHQAGSKVYCDVVGMEHAKKVADLGADGLIAVGYGAGGHAGTVAQFALIPLLSEKIKLPVLAAGSIVDGRGMTAALALGASGVYLGTRFIATKEAEVQEKYKETILNATSDSIVNTDRVDGFPGNFILTPELKKLGVDKGFFELLFSQSRRVKRSISLMRAGKAMLGKDSEKATYRTIFSAGHGSGLIDSVLSVEEVMEKMVNEYQEIKKDLP